MSKHLFIPRNSGEAERFLWHAMEHISTAGWLNNVDVQQARRIIADAIDRM